VLGRFVPRVRLVRVQRQFDVAREGHAPRSRHVARVGVPRSDSSKHMERRQRGRRVGGARRVARDTGRLWASLTGVAANLAYHTATHDCHESRQEQIAIIAARTAQGETTQGEPGEASTAAYRRLARRGRVAAESRRTYNVRAKGPQILGNRDLADSEKSFAGRKLARGRDQPLLAWRDSTPLAVNRSEGSQGHWWIRRVRTFRHGTASILSPCRRTVGSRG
jgi:hypothetical protein